MVRWRHRGIRVPASLQTFNRSRQSPLLASASLPPRVRDALDDVVALVIEYMAGPIERMLDDLETELLRTVDTLEPAQRMQRLAQVHALQRHRTRIPAQLIDRLEAELASLRTPPAAPAQPVAGAQPPAPAAAGSNTEWRLLEDDEAHHDALLRTVSARYESRAGLALQLLGQRFGVLGACPAFDAERLPVGPHRLAEHTLDACHGLELDTAGRQRLVALFEQHVLMRYEELADAMNDVLAQRGVLPSMSFVPIRKPPRVQAAADAPAPATAAAAGSGDAKTGAAPLAVLRSLLARRRAAIARLRAPQPRRRATDAPAAWQATLPGVDAAAAGPSGSDDAHADVREIVELWFARILREVRAGSASASWLEALRPAVVQVALRDPHLFDHADHPMRTLLDAIVEAGEPGWDDELDPALEGALAHAAAEAAAAGGDLRVLRSANAAIDDARSAAARRADIAERRLVEAARGRERLAEARARAAAAIAGLLRERTLPRVARTLVEQAWADVLTLTALRAGADGADWTRQIATTREIIDVATGAAPAPDLAARIREALTAIGTHDEEAALIAAHLGASEPADDDSAASRTELLVRLKARTRLGAEALPDSVQTASLSPAERERLAALPVGEADAWYEFDGSPPVRRRLVWTGAATNTALFVNRRGQRSAELALDTLARALDAGRVRALAPDARGGVARAWDAMLAALRGFEQDGETPHA